MQFRYQALQRKREPDELDAPVLLAAPRGWIAVFVVMIVMAGACVWAAFARLDVTVDAPGVLSHPGGTSQVQSPYTGMARELLVRPAQEVRAGQAVARLTDDAGRVRTVISPFAGKVISATMTSGQVVRIGTTLATVERTDLPGDRLVALVFVPADQAARLVPGRPVALSVSTAPPPRTACCAAGSHRSTRTRSPGRPSSHWSAAISRLTATTRTRPRAWSPWNCSATRGRSPDTPGRPPTPHPSSSVHRRR